MKEAYKKILEANSIVLITHINPDGDTISSALALYPHLKRLGKKVYLYNKEKELPIRYDFLANFKKFRDVLPSRYDLAIVLDAGDFKRIGVESLDAPIINIDHHKSNTNFGDFNIVDFSKPSTTLVLYDFLVKNEVQIARDIAQAIYTGLVSDSDFFSYRGVDSEVFKVASHLVSCGAKPDVVATNLKERDSLAKLRLTEFFYKSIELKSNAKVAIGEVTNNDFLTSGAMISDSDHLVNIIISLSTVNLAIFLRQIDKQRYKFSLRSKGEFDVSLISKEFGGGGHKNAAGFVGKKDHVEKIIKKYEVENV